MKNSKQGMKKIAAHDYTRLVKEKQNYAQTIHIYCLIDLL